MTVEIGHPTVIEAVAIEQNGVLRVDFRGNQLGLLLPGIALPPVLAVPALAKDFAVVEFHFQGDGQNEVTLAVNNYNGNVLGFALLLFFRRVFVGPVGAVAFGSLYSVVQHLRSPHRLVPIPIQVLARDFIYRAHEIIASWMLEAIAFEVNVLGFAHF